MSFKFNNDNKKALIWTVIIHGVLFLILSLCVLRTIVPDEDSGILVNFGNVMASVGAFEPQQSAQPINEVKPVLPKEKSVPVVQKPEKAKEEIITQKEEETVKLPEKNKVNKKEEKKEQVKTPEKPTKKDDTEAEKQRLAEEKRKQEEAKRKQEQQATDISNRVSGAFGKSNSSQESENQGNSESGTGNQGNPFGNSDTGPTEGIGGVGSFNLSGRTLGSGGLPRPAYNVQQEGVIVIDIIVDPNGNVVEARVSPRGTNIDNASLRNSAIAAAKRAKFNKIQGTNNQSGTITYRYKFN